MTFSAFCAERCDKGFYGQDCMQPCDCNGSPCDAISGLCQCSSGYIGPHCERVRRPRNTDTFNYKTSYLNCLLNGLFSVKIVLIYPWLKQY